MHRPSVRESEGNVVGCQIVRSQTPYIPPSPSIPKPLPAGPESPTFGTLPTLFDDYILTPEMPVLLPLGPNYQNRFRKCESLWRLTRLRSVCQYRHRPTRQKRGFLFWRSVSIMELSLPSWSPEIGSLVVGPGTDSSFTSSAPWSRYPPRSLRVVGAIL